ncbi:MAG: hypothetical protein HND58_01350 [Planctomycetota bacterium]|nr:MAG: hypothetical protein HND58_01350 [Planctomycetota bacterium]
MPQPRASPTRIDISTASRFITGSAPGRASTVGSIRVLGAASSSAALPACAGLGARENILLRVASSTWISMPTTSSTRSMSSAW